MDHQTPVILDTNCLKHLRSPAESARLAQQLRVLNGTPLISAINVHEVLRHPVDHYRDELLNVIRQLADGRPMLPWPFTVLECVGRSILVQQAGFPLASGRVDRPLDATLLAELRTLAEQEASELESNFARMFKDGRPKIRRFIKDHGLNDAWSGVRPFLDEFWMRPSHIDDYFTGVWHRLDLPDPVPVAQLRQNPTWRLFFEAHGVAAYEQAFLPNQPRPFGFFDLLQLIYVTGFPLSHFVTAEVPLKRAADILFQGVPGARASTFADFFDGGHVAA